MFMQSYLLLIIIFLAREHNNMLMHIYLLLITIF